MSLYEMCVGAPTSFSGRAPSGTGSIPVHLAMRQQAIDPPASIRPDLEDPGRDRRADQSVADLSPLVAEVRPPLCFTMCTVPACLRRTAHAFTSQAAAAIARAGFQAAAAGISPMPQVCVPLPE